MATARVKDLLLSRQLNSQEVSTLLEPYGIRNASQADSNLQAMAGDPNERLLLADILEELLVCISESANPDRSLNGLERFASAAGNRAHLYTYLRQSRRTLEILAKSLGGSAYMTEILIRDPHYFYWVADPQILEKPRRKRSIQRDLVQTLKAVCDERAQLDLLRVVKRREMLHIGVRDLLRLSTVEETLTALSVLAEALISTAYWICAMSLRREYAVPPDVYKEFTVLAMGKLGGGELNFSSDVDLMYLYSSGDKQSPSISAEDYFRKLGLKITAGLNDFTDQGYVYRVDLRLRPEGKSGNLADPLEGYERYYRARMGSWERLALLKAWPVAGSRVLGNAFLEMTRPFIYGKPLDAVALDDIRSMKEKTDRQAAARSRGGRNVKLGAGGIREIELIVQTLQVRHGSRLPVSYARNTLRALDALKEAETLSPADSENLRSAYLFLRDVENKLQMVDDAQTHSLPTDPDALLSCARLLGYSRGDKESHVDPFHRDVDRHTGAVRRLFERFVGNGEKSGD